MDDFARSVSFPIRFIRNETRLRFAANFAKCLTLCTGDIAILTDQDDVWIPNRIQVTVAAFEASPKLTFTFSDAPLIDDSGKQIGRKVSGLKYPKSDMAILAKGESMFPFLLRDAGLLGCTMAVRRDLLRLVLPLPDPWPHDTWIGLALSSLRSSMRTEPVMNYRQHANQYVGAEMQSRLGKLKVISYQDSAKKLLEMEHTENAIAAAAKHPELHTVSLRALHERLEFLRTRYAMKQVGPAATGTWLRVVFSRNTPTMGLGRNQLRSTLLFYFVA